MSIEQNLDLNELMQVRMDKLKELKEKGINPFGQKFNPTYSTKEILDQSEELIASGQEVIIAGRMMAKGDGKAGLLTCRI